MKKERQQRLVPDEIDITGKWRIFSDTKIKNLLLFESKQRLKFIEATNKIYSIDFRPRTDEL